MEKISRLKSLTDLNKGPVLRLMAKAKQKILLWGEGIDVDSFFGEEKRINVIYYIETIRMLASPQNQ